MPQTYITVEWLATQPAPPAHPIAADAELLDGYYRIIYPGHTNKVLLQGQWAQEAWAKDRLSCLLRWAIVGWTDEFVVSG